MPRALLCYRAANEVSSLECAECAGETTRGGMCGWQDERNGERRTETGTGLLCYIVYSMQWWWWYTVERKRTGRGLNPRVPVGRGTGVSIWDRSQGIFVLRYVYVLYSEPLAGWLGEGPAGLTMCEIGGINKLWSSHA